jgi:hypothetical protein
MLPVVINYIPLRFFSIHVKYHMVGVSFLFASTSFVSFVLPEKLELMHMTGQAVEHMNTGSN